MLQNKSDPFNRLQNAVGNQALQRLIRSGTIRPKLKVSLPNDVYEKEADRVAEQIMETPISNSTSTAMYSKDDKISRKCVACEMEEKEEEDDNKKVKLSIGRKSLSNSNNLEATDEITNQINKVRSSEGSSLDNATRDFLEPKLGYDLSDVRIHTGEMAARSAPSLNSLAYTIGNDVIFGEGQYEPYSEKGKKLLAHELTHVVQQDYQETRPKRIRSDHIGQLIQRVPAPGRNFGTRSYCGFGITTHIPGFIQGYVTEDYDVDYTTGCNWIWWNAHNSVWECMTVPTNS